MFQSLLIRTSRISALLVAGLSSTCAVAATPLELHVHPATAVGMEGRDYPVVYRTSGQSLKFRISLGNEGSTPVEVPKWISGTSARVTMSVNNLPIPPSQFRVEWHSPFLEVDGDRLVLGPGKREEGEFAIQAAGPRALPSGLVELRVSFGKAGKAEPRRSESFAGGARFYLVEPQGADQERAARLAEGWQLAQAGDLRRALAVFQDLRTSDGDRPEILSSLGTVLVRLGRYEDAAPIIRSAMKESAGEKSTLPELLAKCLLAKGDENGAWKTLLDQGYSDEGATAALQRLKKSLSSTSSNVEKNQRPPAAAEARAEGAETGRQ